MRQSNWRHNEAFDNQGLNEKEKRAVIFIKKSDELKIPLKGKTELPIFRD